MKLNEDWDQVYRSATLGLQHRLETLELENTAIKQLNTRLLLKVEHQQVNRRKFFEHATIPPEQCTGYRPSKVGVDTVHRGIPKLWVTVRPV